jgi:large subunit ribosomal protein L25
MATLNAKLKEKSGKKQSKKIRTEGLVPAVIYGEKLAPVSISLNPVEFVKQLNHSKFKKNQIFEVLIDNGANEKVITKEINVNPLNNQFVHIDFLRVSDTTLLSVNVPIDISGTAAGQRLGGVLVKQKTYVKVDCVPSEIPENIKIDVTKLGIGDSFRVKDIITSDVTISSNPNDILVKIDSTKLSKTAQQGAETNA